MFRDVNLLEKCFYSLRSYKDLKVKRKKKVFSYLSELGKCIDNNLLSDIFVQWKKYTKIRKLQRAVLINYAKSLVAKAYLGLYEHYCNKKVRGYFNKNVVSWNRSIHSIYGSKHSNFLLARKYNKKLKVILMKIYDMMNKNIEVALPIKSITHNLLLVINLFKKAILWMLKIFTTAIKI